MLLPTAAPAPAGALVTERSSLAVPRELPRESACSRYSGKGFAESRSRIRSGLAVGSRSRIPTASITKPGVQKPHWRA
jgi:hypothetical protein